MKTYIRTALALVAAIGLLATGCDRIDELQQYNEPGTTPAPDKGAAAELRLGYLNNITHAAALIGVEKGYFTKELGTDTKLTTQTFNDGTEAVSALLGHSLDIAFLGSGPAINAFARSNGAVRLVAGAASGGAQLVAKPGIDGAEQLKGKKVATPKLGNTQDIALKKWLADGNIEVGTGPDQVTVVNSDNPLTFDAFRNGELDAAWLPEPWASRLVLDAGATVVVDEKELWPPDGRYPTTVVIARTEFLRDHPQTVQAFLRAELAAIEWATENAAEARKVANTALAFATGKPLADPVIQRAFGNLTLTHDPLAARFEQLALDSVLAAVAKTPPDLAGFVDLGPLNAVLTAAGKPTVNAAGLDRK